MHDRQLWNRPRVLLCGATMVVGTLGVTIGVLSLIALLPPSLPLFLGFLFVGLLAIVAAPSLNIVVLNITLGSGESE